MHMLSARQIFAFRSEDHFLTCGGTHVNFSTLLTHKFVYLHCRRCSFYTATYYVEQLFLKSFLSSIDNVLYFGSEVLVDKDMQVNIVRG